MNEEAMVEVYFLPMFRAKNCHESLEGSRLTKVCIVEQKHATLVPFRE